MQLTSLYVSGFRSFKEKNKEKDNTPFLVDERITVLIGANDHGKSNVLEAIARLNDDMPITEDDRNWDLEKEKQPKLEWHFTLNPEELEKLSKSTPATPKPEPPVAATEPIKEGEFPPTAVIDASEIISSPTFFKISAKKNVISYSREGIGNAVKVESTPFEIEKQYEKQLLDLRPRVELFEIPPGNNVVDQIEKKQLDDKTDVNHEFIKGLFISADIWDMREDLFGDTDKSAKKIEIASNQLTKVMQEKWAQNDGSLWKLRQAGKDVDTLYLRIEEDAVNEIDVPPSRKSSGFRTFFLLSMMITARIYDSKDKPHIFLFDEPGTYLHPRAQIDLQRSFEKRAEEAQIAYTTHSLFLVSKNYPKRNRVISKTNKGTKVNQKPFISNWKSVRDSLGIVMSNNFLIADKSILFEGPSDQFYLYNAIRKLKHEGVDIDLNDFSTVDGGDSENYLAMAKVLIEEGRSILCIADGDGGGTTILDGVKKVRQNEIEKKKAFAKKNPDEDLIPDPAVNYLQLDDGKSVEDIFADKKLLLTAIENVAENLVEMGVRKFKNDFKTEDGLAKISAAKGKTLGAIIDEQTKEWFEKEEKISKLAIALEYDRLAQDEEYTVSKEAKKLVLQIKEVLALKGEKSAENGVLGEVE